MTALAASVILPVELQALGKLLGVEKSRFDGERSTSPIDVSVFVNPRYDLNVFYVVAVSQYVMKYRELGFLMHKTEALILLLVPAWICQ